MSWVLSAGSCGPLPPSPRRPAGCRRESLDTRTGLRDARGEVAELAASSTRCSTGCRPRSTPSAASWPTPPRAAHSAGGAAHRGRGDPGRPRRRRRGAAPDGRGGPGGHPPGRRPRRRACCCWPGPRAPGWSRCARSTWRRWSGRRWRRSAPRPAGAGCATGAAAAGPGPGRPGAAGAAGRQPGGERGAAQRRRRLDGGVHRPRPRCPAQVASSGPEIAGDRVAELFEPFRRGRWSGPARRGTGLGLSIVRAVVLAATGPASRRSRRQLGDLTAGVAQPGPGVQRLHASAAAPSR